MKLTRYHSDDASISDRKALCHGVGIKTVMDLRTKYG